MKTKLEQLTIADFIELLVGDMRPICENENEKSNKDLEKIRRNIIFEYREIIEIGSTKSYIINNKELLHSKATLAILEVCRLLMSLEEYRKCREILTSIDINVVGKSNSQLNNLIISRIGRSKRIIEKLQDETTLDVDPEQIRKSFDEQTAAMMAHFKFQIDMTTMKATVYAHLVARQNREIKAQMSAFRKK